MALVCLNYNKMNGNSGLISRSLERILEEAMSGGELRLSGRKLNRFPKSAEKYDLKDTVFAGKLVNL